MSQLARNPMLVPELFQCILDHLSAPTDRYERRALAALARTCLAFSDPALDRLWREVGSLSPLIRCFMPQSQNVAVHHLYDSCTRVDEPNLSTPTEWAAVSRYAHRIRKLTIYHECLSLRFLKSARAHTPLLLPNLRVLIHRGSVDLIRPLLSPTLVELEARFTGGDGERLLSFFKSYHLQCPHLEGVTFYLRMDGDGDDEEIDGHATLSAAITFELSRALCCHKRLKRLRIVNSHIDADALKWLSASQMIRDISIEFDPIESTSQQFFLPEEVPFGHVEKLGLTTSDLDFITFLLRSQDQIFHDFRLHITNQPTVGATLRFFSTLASRQDVRSLQSINVSFTPLAFDVTTGSASLDSERVHRVSHRSLLALTSFSHLRHLLMDWGHEISLDDGELAQLARNWPLLESFVLNCHQAPAVHGLSPKYLTLRALLILVTSCPDLTHICVPLDATEVPANTGPEPSHGHGIWSTSITTLEFPESPIGDAPLVALFLWKRFPRLVRVDGESRRHLRISGSAASASWKHEWQKVDCHLFRLQTGLN